MIHHTIEHKTRYSLIFDPRLYDSLNFGTQWTRIVDFSLLVYFWVSVIFFLNPSLVLSNADANESEPKSITNILYIAEKVISLALP